MKTQYIQSLPEYTRHNGGFILISSLFMLIILTLIAVAMGRSFRLEETMSGNSREKNRAMTSAQGALSYAEWWLTQNSSNGTTTCTAGHGTTVSICTAATGVASGVSAANSISGWQYTDYTPTMNSNNIMSFSTTGGVAPTSAPAGLYYANPGFNIAYLGIDTGGNSIYQITAFGYGGNQAAFAVVQSTYRLSQATKDLGGH